jgi:two-component system cell cycle sensor histidine kinase/response regulator CckA
MDASPAVLDVVAPAPVVWRVLLVGNREEDFFLIREILTRHRNAFTADLDHAHSVDEAKVMLLQKEYGLILFDFDTADTKAVHLLSESRKGGSSIPFVLLTEHADEKTIAGIISAGVSDYIDKSELTGVNFLRTIRSSVALHSMQQEKQVAEGSLRKLSRAVEQAADAIMITDRQGVIEYVNPAFETLSGYSSEEVSGRTPQILKSAEQSPQAYGELWETILSGRVYRSILANRKKNGDTYYIEQSISPVRDDLGTITHFISNGRDLTDRLRLEAQLLQSQKMDAIGRLAGGVAHDFNNLLTIITSYSELSLDAVVPGSPLEKKIQEILGAARRAAQLTRQLLAFSRKQVQAPRVVDLNKVIQGIVKTLPRLIGEDIHLDFLPGVMAGRVRVDPVQIEQILMNLAANARDAMLQGGRLTIATSEVELTDEYIQLKHAVMSPGWYAMVSVSDNGSGISAAHLSHIFEPFYTTKPLGKGTGLGLATVYGIVKQNKGFVWAYSELEMGTIFRIYLPCIVDHQLAMVIGGDDLAAPALGDETILIVEDEDAVRRATGEFLTQQGYTVLEARDGLDALSVVKDHGSTIHLVITDVVMPNMSGGQLARELERRRPETAILFISGYPGKTVTEHNVVDFDTNFLQKPFTLKELSSKIRDLLSHAVAEKV